MNERDKVKQAIARIVECRQALQHATDTVVKALAQETAASQATARSVAEAGRIVRAVYGKGKHKIVCQERLFEFTSGDDEQPSLIESEIVQL